MSFKRALVWTKPRYLGDAVMATPLLDGLSRECPHVDVLVTPAVTELLRDRAHVLRFVTSGPEVGFWGPVNMAIWLRRERPDAVFLLNRSFRSALGAFLGGVPVRVGHATERRGPLLTHPVPYQLDAPEIGCGLSLLEAVGIAPSTLHPKLALTPEETAQGVGRLQGATVGLQPGARYPEKRIPVEISCALVRQLTEAGHRVALVGGGDEREQSDAVAEQVGVPVVNLVGQMGLRESMGAVAGLQLLVGADTGFVHVAAAVGCPTVGVYGPNSAQKWGHHYEPHQVLEAPGRDMARLTTEMVMQACDRVLGRTTVQSL